METLPPELVCLSAEFLCARDILRLAQCCRSLHHCLIPSRALWRLLCERTWAPVVALQECWELWPVGVQEALQSGEEHPLSLFQALHAEYQGLENPFERVVRVFNKMKRVLMATSSLAWYRVAHGVPVPASRIQKLQDIVRMTSTCGLPKDLMLFYRIRDGTATPVFRGLFSPLEGEREGGDEYLPTEEEVRARVAIEDAQFQEESARPFEEARQRFMTGGPEFDLGGHISGELFGVFGLLPFEVILRSCHSICIREGEQERVLLPLVGFSFDDPSNIGEYRMWLSGMVEDGDRQEDPRLIVCMEHEPRTVVYSKGFLQMIELRCQQIEDLQECTGYRFGSTAVTHGIRVDVAVHFRGEPIDVESFSFSYRITITNESNPCQVKLTDRHWDIVDGDGPVETVDGPAVVGYTPELSPGQTFQYNSFCGCESGRTTMSGYFRFIRLSGDPQGCPASFQVEVAPFVMCLALDPLSDHS